MRKTPPRSWPTHRGRGNRQRRPRPRRMWVASTLPQTYEGMARSLVSRGLASTAIIEGTVRGIGNQS